MIRELRGDNIPMSFPANVSHAETLAPAMKITDQTEADQWFEALVEFSMVVGKQSREVAENFMRRNLAYYAGYYDHETRERVERLFHCEHPYFGSIAKNGAPTTEEAFEMGRKMAEQMRRNQHE